MSHSFVSLPDNIDLAAIFNLIYSFYPLHAITLPLVWLSTHTAHYGASKGRHPFKGSAFDKKIQIGLNFFWLKNFTLPSLAVSLEVPLSLSLSSPAVACLFTRLKLIAGLH